MYRYKHTNESRHICNQEGSSLVYHACVPVTPKTICSYQTYLAIKFLIRNVWFLSHQVFQEAVSFRFDVSSNGSTLLHRQSGFIRCTRMVYRCCAHERMNVWGRIVNETISLGQYTYADRERCADRKILFRGPYRIIVTILFFPHLLRAPPTRNPSPLRYV